MLSTVTRQHGFNTSNIDISFPPIIQRYWTFSFMNFITCKQHAKNILNKVKVKRSNTY